MNEPNKEINRAPESYSPKEKSKILDIAEKYQSEKLVETINYKGAVFEVVQRPEILWVGKIAYASNLIDEPDIGKLLGDYQDLVPVAKLERINPDWDAAISIDYWRNGTSLKGMMFAQETATEKQDKRYDLYRMPASLFIRILNDSVAAGLLEKEKCENWELFSIIKDNVMPEFGYKFNENGSQEIEYHNYRTNTFYAYVPVVKI